MYIKIDWIIKEKEKIIIKIKKRIVKKKNAIRY